MAILADGRQAVHIVSSEQFDRAALDDLLSRAAALAEVRDRRLAGRIMATLFYEPSTRTRLSFESAMLRLGGDVLGTEAAHEFSSAIKGETLEDTIRMVSAYADVIVLRHDQAGAAARAAAVSTVSVLNAGDGPGEHPTQALLDLYTVRSELGHIDGVHVAFCGDLRFGRTARSLATLLTRYRDVRMTFVAPDVVQIGTDIRERLDAAGIRYTLCDRLDGMIADTDVIYQTRIQRERFSDAAELEAVRSGIRIDAALMSQLPDHAIVMHPLPRVDEISPEVDADPRAAYFRQAANGVAVRMALLDLVVSR